MCFEVLCSNRRVVAVSIAGNMTLYYILSAMIDNCFRMADCMLRRNRIGVLT